MFRKLTSNQPLALILGLSFVLTLGYGFYFRVHPVVDARAYDQIAVNLAGGFGFREDRTKSYEFDAAIIRAGPGYEFFLAGVYKLFGHRYEPVWVIQALLHTVSAGLIFLIARRLFKSYGEKIGLIAAGLFAFSPDLIEIAAMLMSETVYLFFISLTVYLFVRAFADPSNHLLAGFLGLTTGAAILTRPPVVLFVPVFIFLYFSKKQYRPMGVFLLLLLVPLTPWVIRNYLIYHQFILTTLLGEYNLWVGNTQLADGGQIAGGFNPVTAYTDTHGFFGLKEKAGMEFSSFVLAYPLVFLKLCAIRLIRYFSLIRPMGFWFYQSGIGQLAVVGSSLIWIGTLFVSGFAGLISALRERRQIFYYLAVLALTSPLVLIPTVVQSRYRFQIYPFLAIFAGYALVLLLTNKGWWKEKVFWLPTVFLVLMSAVDIFLNIGTIFERIGLFL